MALAQGQGGQAGVAALGFQFGQPWVPATGGEKAEARPRLPLLGAQAHHAFAHPAQAAPLPRQGGGLGATGQLAPLLQGDHQRMQQGLGVRQVERQGQGFDALVDGRAGQCVDLRDGGFGTGGWQRADADRRSTACRGATATGQGLADAQRLPPVAGPVMRAAFICGAVGGVAVQADHGDAQAAEPGIGHLNVSQRVADAGIGGGCRFAAQGRGQRLLAQRPGLHATLWAGADQGHGGHGFAALGVVDLDPHAQQGVLAVLASPTNNRPGARQASTQAVGRGLAAGAADVGGVEETDHLAKDHFRRALADGAVEVRVFGGNQLVVVALIQALLAEAATQLAPAFAAGFGIEQHVVGAVQEHQRHRQVAAQVVFAGVDVLPVGIHQALVLHALGPVHKHAEVGAAEVLVELGVGHWQQLVVAKQAAEGAGHAFARGAVGVLMAQVVLAGAALGGAVVEAGEQAVHQRMQGIGLHRAGGELQQLAVQAVDQQGGHLQAHLRGAGADHERLELREQHAVQLGAAIGMGQMAAEQGHAQGGRADAVAEAEQTAGQGRLFTLFGLQLAEDMLDGGRDFPGGDIVHAGELRRGAQPRADPVFQQPHVPALGVEHGRQAARAELFCDKGQGVLGKTVEQHDRLVAALAVDHLGLDLGLGIAHQADADLLAGRLLGMQRYV